MDKELRENLRKSLDDALTFQKLTATYRTIVRQMLNANPEINDELTVLMIMAHNGMGRVLVEIYKVVEIIQERMSVFGDGEGMRKQLAASFKEDGANDLTDDQMEDEREEYQDGDDDDEYRDEWELPPEA